MDFSVFGHDLFCDRKNVSNRKPVGSDFRTFGATSLPFGR
jgi:hypothetical protein